MPVVKNAYIELLDQLDRLLEGPKNKTSFKLAEFDRKRLRVKFKEDSEQTLQKVFTRFIKIVLSHCGYLESHISKLLKDNSNLEIKIKKVKEESELMLKKYLESNHNSQKILNMANEQVMKFRTPEIKASIKNIMMK